MLENQDAPTLLVGKPVATSKKLEPITAQLVKQKLAQHQIASGPTKSAITRWIRANQLEIRTLWNQLNLTEEQHLQNIWR